MTKEQEVLVFAAAMLFLRARKCVSLESLFDKSVLFFKLATATLLALNDPKYSVYYVLLVLILMVVVRPDKFKVDDDDQVVYLNEVSFRAVTNPEKDERKVMWVVFFHADWCNKSNFLRPIFSKLAKKFTGPRRKFGLIDVEGFPRAAKDFNISVDSIRTKQIPTIILFYKGREITRLPRFTSKGTVVSSVMSQSEIESHFELAEDVSALRRRMRANAASNNRQEEED